MTLPAVGVIGLGAMGASFAQSLVTAGYPVHGYDIAPAAVEAARRIGVTNQPSPAAVGDRSELIITIVWDDAALRQVLFGADGIARASRPPQCVVDLGTTSVDIAVEAGTELAGRAVAFLDGAVIGGGVAAARAGRSPIVIAGNLDAFEHWRTVLAILGSCEYVGRQGYAKAVKLMNNLIVGIVTASNAEALSLGASMGLDAHEMVAAFTRGPAASHVLESYMGRYAESGRYGEGLIGHRLMAKDLRLAAELAESIACDAAFARVGEQQYLEFAREIGEDRPFPSCFEIYRARAASARSTRQSFESTP